MRYRVSQIHNTDLLRNTKTGIKIVRAQEHIDLATSDEQLDSSSTWSWIRLSTRGLMPKVPGRNFDDSRKIRIVSDIHAGSDFFNTATSKLEAFLKSMVSHLNRGILEYHNPGFLG